MLNATDKDCSKNAMHNANNAVQNSNVGSVCVSVNQRSLCADCCNERWEIGEECTETAGIAGV